MASEHDTFFELSMDMLCTTNLEGRIESVSPSWESTLGWSRERLLGRTLLDFVHIEDRSSASEAFRKAARAPAPLRFECRFIHRDGSYRQVAWACAGSNGGKSISACARDVTRQNLASEQLSTAKMQLEAVFDAMLEGLVVHDESGRVTQFNHAALRILGVSESQLLGNSSFDPRWRSVREDLSDCPGDQHPAMITLSTGRPCLGYVMGIHLPSGELRWLSITSLPVARTGSNGPNQVVVTFRDITEERRATAERREMTERLRSQENFLRTTLGALPCTVVYVDRDYVYQYANDAYERLLEIGASEIIGKHVSEIIDQRTYRMLKPLLDEALDGKRQTFELPLELPNRPTRHLQASYLPDIDDAGRVNGIFIVSNDVTEVIESQRLLRKKEDELARIIDSLPSMIGYWDSNLLNVFANRAYVEYFGWEPTRMKGKGMEEVVGPDLFAKNRLYIEGALRGEPQTFEREIALAAGGSRETIAHYIPDIEGDKVVGFMVIITDITRVKELETARRSMEASLIAASKMSSLGEMASGIAHEINNPLAIIRGKAAQVRNALSYSDYCEVGTLADIDKIEATVDRIAKIVRGLQAFSRNAEKDPLSRVNLSKAVSETLDLCQERLKISGVDLRVTTDEKLEICGRSVQICQILMNILSNAVDALEGQREKWIEIKVEGDLRSARICVTDSGPGISEAIAAKMWQPFYTTKEIGKGTGLGLSISKGLIEDHGGSLILDRSRPNTCFVLEFPLPAATAAAKSA